MQPIPFDQWCSYIDRRGLTTVSYFLPEESASKLGVLRDYWHGELGNLEHVRVHKWGGTVKKQYVDEFGSVLFFKRFAIRNLRYIHKPFRARASVLQETRLQSAGFSTAPIVGLIEFRRCGLLIDSVLISEEMAGYQALHHFIDAGGTRDRMSWDERRGLAYELGRLVGRWHNAGFFHGDMHSGNILCKLDGGEFSFSWIDNEEGCQFRQIPMRKRMDDLDHMGRDDHSVPVRDRFRFWEAYTGSCGIDGGQKRKMLKRLSKMTVRYRNRKRVR